MAYLYHQISTPIQPFLHQNQSPSFKNRLTIPLENPLLLLLRQKRHIPNSTNLKPIRHRRCIRKILHPQRSRVSMYPQHHPQISSSTYRPINNLPNPDPNSQQPPNLPRKHRPRNIPPQPPRKRLPTPALHLHRLRCQKPIDCRRESPSSVRNDPFERGEIDQSLRDGEVHEGACCFEVEFDYAGGVEGWVCAGEF